MCTGDTKLPHNTSRALPPANVWVAALRRHASNVHARTPHQARKPHQVHTRADTHLRSVIRFVEPKLNVEQKAAITHTHTRGHTHIHTHTHTQEGTWR